MCFKFNFKQIDWNKMKEVAEIHIMTFFKVAI